MLLVLNDKEHFRSKAFAAFIGCAVTVAVLGVIGMLAGGAITVTREPTTRSGVIDLALGALLLFAGIRRFVKKPKPKKEKPKSAEGKAGGRSRMLKLIGVGFLLTITNPTSLASYLASIKLTLDSGLESSLQIIAVAVAGLYFTLPLLMPLLLAVFAPEKSAKFLDSVGRIFEKYGRYIILAIMLVLAAFLAKKGIDTLGAVH